MSVFALSLLVTAVSVSAAAISASVSDAAAAAAVVAAGEAGVLECLWTAASGGPVVGSGERLLPLACIQSRKL